MRTRRRDDGYAEEFPKEKREEKREGPAKRRDTDGGVERER
jgi:hypothetical protein